MAAWREIERDTPEFADRVRLRFDAGTNKTLATLQRDRSPRVSATELQFCFDGEVTLGMMSGSVKLLDVRRDPASRRTARHWSRRQMIPGRATRGWPATSSRSTRRQPL